MEEIFNSAVWPAAVFCFDFDYNGSVMSAIVLPKGCLPRL